MNGINIWLSVTIFLILPLLLIASIPYSANAQVKASDFLTRCEVVEVFWQNPENITEKDRIETAWCAGFVSGILDGYNFGVALKGDHTFAKSVSICPPDEVTDIHSLLVSIREFRTFPQTRNGNTATVLTAILSTKWPCN
jgi:hypothetical protein